MRLVLSTTADPAPPESTFSESPWSLFESPWTFIKSRTRRRILDCIGLALWVYAILAIFVFDPGRYLLGSIANYRFFFFLAASASALIILRKKRWALVVALLYLLLFPAIVLCVKLPYLLYRTKSWLLAFAVMNVILAIATNIRYTILFAAAASCAALAIFIDGPKYLTASAASIIACLLLLAITRSMIRAATTPGFLRLQQQALSKANDHGLFSKLTTADEEWLATTKFTPEQQRAFAQKLESAIFFHSGLLYWASQLDRYRRSAASWLLSALALVAIMAQTILGFALINKALYLMDHDAFEYATTPSFIVFVRYSVASLSVNEIDAVVAESDLANLVAIAGNIIGPLLIVTILGALILSRRQASDDDDLRTTIAAIRRESIKLDRQLQQQFEVSTAEAIARLRQLDPSMVNTELLDGIEDWRNGLPDDIGEHR